MRSWMLLPACAIALHAQAVKDYDFHLDNGAHVLYQTYGQADANLGTARAFGNTIERNVMDGKNVRQLGFQLRIDKLPGDPIRFRVSMGGPLEDLRGGFWGYFGRTAPPREIQNGDRVILDVLEESATGRKIFDTFQVGIGIGMHTMPVAKTVPQTPAAGAVIHLQNPELLAGTTVLGKSSSALSGGAIRLRVRNKGTFSFSTRAEPGYRMEAIAEGHALMFVTGGDRYDIECASPVMDGAGAWYLWVRQDAEDFRSSAPELLLTLP
jgi:hypothetical protein